MDDGCIVRYEQTAGLASKAIGDAATSASALGRVFAISLDEDGEPEHVVMANSFSPMVDIRRCIEVPQRTLDVFVHASTWAPAHDGLCSRGDQ